MWLWDFTTISWALCAKNALTNNNGFRPAQLLFGRNRNLPNFLDNKLPAQENPISLDIASHISDLHAPSESSSKLKLVVPKNIRKSVFSIGDDVFYKRDDKLAWKVPGWVLGQDGPVVFIWHGLHYIKAHSCRGQLTNPSLYNNNPSQTSNTIPLA